MLSQENLSESNDEGFKITVEKPIKIDKKEFFKFLIMNKTLNLTILRLGKTTISKFTKDKKGNWESGFFIDYAFKFNNVDYEVGIWYDIGVEIKEETFLLTDEKDILKILAIITDVRKAKKMEVTKEWFEENLAGLRFKGTFGKNFKGLYIIKAVRKL